MNRKFYFRLGLALTLALMAAAPAVTVASEPQAGPAAPGCTAPPALTALEPPLAHTAVRMERHQPLTVVAVGSSSTQGVGASAPSLNYASRLEAELKERFPESEIRVLNRGKGGQDVGEELDRLGTDVVAENPDLIIWQVGTNAVLRRDDLVLDGDLIRRGVDLLKQNGADIVLMDLQYAPRVLQRASYAEMERLIADAAKQERIGLFRRFEIMQYWQSSQPDAPTIGADGLHMNDRGYGCLAAELADSLARNWSSYQQAHRPAQPAAVAGLRPKLDRGAAPGASGAQ